MAIRLIGESQIRPSRVTRELPVPSGDLLRVLAASACVGPFHDAALARQSAFRLRTP